MALTNARATEAASSGARCSTKSDTEVTTASFAVALTQCVYRHTFAYARGSCSGPVAQLAPKPAHLSWDEAEARPLAGLTAYRAVFSRG